MAKNKSIRFDSWIGMVNNTLHTGAAKKQQQLNSVTTSHERRTSSVWPKSIDRHKSTTIDAIESSRVTWSVTETANCKCYNVPKLDNGCDCGDDLIVVDKQPKTNWRLEVRSAPEWQITADLVRRNNCDLLFF